MSHVSRIAKAEFVDRAILELALGNCPILDSQIAGVGQVVNEVTDYGATVAGDFACKIDPSKFGELGQWMKPQGIAFAKDETGAYQIICDQYGRRETLIAQFLDILSSRYAYHATIQTLQAEGFILMSETNEDGETVLVLEKIS